MHKKERRIMFCSNCGTPIESERNNCQNCGHIIETDILIRRFLEQSNRVEVIRKRSVSKIILFSILAITVLCMFFMAATIVGQGGSDIGSIQSVSGDSIAEAYYNGMGTIYSGIAIAINAVGIFLSAILMVIGLQKGK
jgi:hypothetical protein